MLQKSHGLPISTFNYLNWGILKNVYAEKPCMSITRGVSLCSQILTRTLSGGDNSP